MYDDPHHGIEDNIEGVQNAVLVVRFGERLGVDTGTVSICAQSEVWL